LQVLRTVAEVRALVARARNAGRIVGLVPTMGALHEGHQSLIRRAAAECDLVVVSVFVNPTQFGPQEDFDRYPRNVERDAELAAEAGADAVFAPGVGEMYPEGYQTYVTVERVTAGLCGAHRPGHFRGVATVVLKLFNICRPHRAYFGEKDFQQLVVIRRLVSDLNVDLEVVGCETVREPDGLALSSRNQYLTDEERRVAPLIYRALRRAAEGLRSGQLFHFSPEQIVRGALGREPRMKVEYVEFVDPVALEPKDPCQLPVVIAVAVHLGQTRLIDHVIIEGREDA